MKQMKRTGSLLLALVMILSLGLSLCFAEGEWSEAYYRVGDETGQLQSEDIENLDLTACWIVSSYGVDAVAFSVTDESLGDFTWEGYAEAIYDGFGYGENHDGVLLLYNGDTKKKEIFAFGKAEEYFSSEVRSQICSSIVSNVDEYGVYGLFSDFFAEVIATLQSHVDDGTLIPVSEEVMSESAYLLQEGASDPTAEETAEEPLLIAAEEEEEAPAEDTADSAVEDVPLVISENPTTGLPDWYPENPENFEYFTDPDASRVVDLADIFTAEEESAILEAIETYTAKSGKDIVVYTDTTTYGFSEEIWAADFYDFNGYGCGEDREGVCLFICMDPDNRCWWCCCTGPETEELYDYDASETIDDRLYAYVRNGNYAAGVENWVKNIGTLLATGRVPKAPGYWLKTVFFAVLVGALVGWISVGRAKSTMKTVKKAENANAYLARNSLNVAREGRDIPMGVTTQRRRIAPSSSGNGRGSSSHSGSYHGSSGSSHSGSGRHF